MLKAMPNKNKFGAKKQKHFCLHRAAAADKSAGSLDKPAQKCDNMKLYTDYEQGV